MMQIESTPRIQGNAMLPNFETHYPPSDIRSVPLQAAEQYQGTLPAEILYLWQTYGWGKYGDGLIELVNPQDYSDNLRQWLGSEKPHYTPFAITAFGELFYHRKLSAEGDEDICLLDIQYSSCKVLDWNTRDFFENTLCDEEFRQTFLREGLFRRAVQQQGSLHNGEAFLFQPILALGGLDNEDNQLERLGKGSAVVYQTLVFELTS